MKEIISRSDEDQEAVISRQEEDSSSMKAGQERKNPAAALAADLVAVVVL